jgi:hypothetical protein
VVGSESGLTQQRSARVGLRLGDSDSEGRAAVTCYQRHLTGLFDRLELDYDKPNRDAVHEALVDVLRLPDGAHCPEVWKALKDRYGPVDENLDVMARDVTAVLGSHD